MEYRLELDKLAAMIPVEYHGDLAMYREAIEAVRVGDEDRLLCFVGEDEPWARAYQIVAMFDLTAFTLPKN